MIKINLLKDSASQKTQVEHQAGFQIPGIKKVQGAGQSSLLQRAIIFIVPILLAYVYGWYSNYQLDEKISTLQKESQTLEKKSEALKPELENIEKLNAEKNKILAEVGAIKNLSLRRYTYIKILDSLQSLIPEKVWLTKMSLKDRGVAIEGRASDDTVISKFMQNLEESAYFQNVTWESSREVSEPQGVVKQFNIQFGLENLK